MQKSILITGASGNLGHAVVQKFVAAGFQVYGTGRSLASIAGVELSSVDLQDAGAVSTYLQQLCQGPSSLSGAVLLVGGYAPGTLPQTDAQSIREQYALNFETAYHVVQNLLPYFEAQGGGQFVLIGSRAALEPAAALYNVAYALSKSMLLALAEIINAYGKTKGIRCSVVVPGTIDTPPNREAMPNADFSKWSSPAAIAETIHFLFTEAGQEWREVVLKVYND